MTGYGRSQKNFEDRTVTVEIKSVNSKSFDLKLRLPMHYQSKEIELRRQLNDELLRGKVDFTLTLSGHNNADFNIDFTAFQAYHRQLNDISNQLQLDKGDLLYTITRLPGVVVQNDSDIEEEEWKQILTVIKDALSKINSFRAQEGKVLQEDMMMRINLIVSLIPQVEAYEIERIDKIKQRLKDNLEQFLPHVNLDENRYEQEIVYYLDKLDITEEKIRLAQHCKFFNEVCSDNKDSLDKGKKLNFIIQEIGREVNTLGSKANFAEMQRIVIKMKEEADKIKEQIANIL
jgi:uncharacterized protein (TIGR00255 family)